MGELLDLFDKTAERVRQEDAQYDMESARGIVEASDGNLSGFTSEAGTDEGGAEYRRTTFHRAQRNMNLAAGMNPEAEAAAVRASRETGMPVSATREWDNQQLKKPDLDTLSPKTVKFLGDDLSNAAVSKDDVEAVDAVVQTADYASMSLKDRRESMQEQIKAEGYTPSQLADLKKNGYTPVTDGKDGKFTKEIGGLQATFTWPQMDSWYTNPEEAQGLEEQRQAYDTLIRDQFDNVRGSAWFVNASPETQAEYIQRLDKEIAVMRGLWGLYGEQWQDFNDEELAAAVQQTGEALGIDNVSDISVNRLRPAGVGLSTTDWADLVNFFGIQDMYKRFTGLRPEELDLIHKNPLGFPLMDRMDLVDELEKQAKELRGRSGWNKGTEMTITSLRFATELAAAGGGALESVAETISTQGLKGIPSALAKLFGGMAKLIPGRTMQAAEEAIERVEPEITQIIQDGQVLPGLTEDETDKLATRFFNAVLSNYIEDVSEGVGAFVPVSKLLGAAFKLIPARVRNAAFASAVKGAVDRLAKTKGAQWAKKFTTASGFSGIPEEDLEEIMGDAARFAVTQLSDLLGTEIGNLGQDTVFNGWDAETERLIQLAATGIIMQGIPRAVAAPYDIYKTKQFRTAQKAIKERVDAATTMGKRSPEIMEHLLRRYTGMTDVAYLTPEAAEALYQSMPETMDAVGVTKELIGEAETKERLVPVSMARVHTHASAEEVNAMLESLIPDPKNLLTPGEADKIVPADVSKELSDASAEAEKTRGEFAEALERSMKQLEDAGRSKTEVKADAKLLSHLSSYLGEHNTAGKTAADILNDITIESISEPEFMARLAEKPSLYQGVIGIPGFYSNMMQSLKDAPQQKMTPAQWMAYLQKSGGLKAGETSWRGSIEKFFEGRDPKVAVDRQELIDAFENGMVDILEMHSGNAEEFDVNEYKEGTPFSAESIADLREQARRAADRIYEASTPAQRLAAKNERDELAHKANALKDIGVIFDTEAHGAFREKGAAAGDAAAAAGLEYLSDDVINQYLSHWKSPGEMEDSDFAVLHAIEQRLKFEMQKAADAFPKRDTITSSATRARYTTHGLSPLRELVIYAPEVGPFEADDSIHFGTDTKGTALVWVRFGETTDADGKRVLVIDEIQSNRHQAGRDKGYYRTEEERLTGDYYAVPAAPFEKNWHELGMKRMIRYAAEHGFDKIAWTSGEQQAKRYNIGSYINEIILADKTVGGAIIEAPLANGHSVLTFTVSKDGNVIDSNQAAAIGKPVSEVFGKEVGSKVMDLIEGKTGEPRSWWVGAVRFQYYDDAGNAELRVDGEREFGIRIDREGTIVADTVRTDDLGGDTVFEVFGDEVGQQILDYAFDEELNDKNSLTPKVGARAHLLGTRIQLDRDVVFGGEGMKAFYDRILKQFTEKYIKKWGAKVGVVTLPDVEEAGREMWGFDVTPAMKAAVMGRGQPLFQSDPWIRKLYGDIKYAPRIHRPDDLGFSQKKKAEVDRQRAEVRAKYEGTDKWLKAPNGKPSNLSEDLWITVRTQFFKDWFGDWEKEGGRRDARLTSEDSVPITSAQSRASMNSHPYSQYTPGSGKSQVGILDLNGEPLVIHHGTQDRFGAFARGDTGYHFGTKEQASDRVTEINLLGKRGELKENAGRYEGFVNIRNPYYIPKDLGSFEPWAVAEYILGDGKKDAPMPLTEAEEKQLHDEFYNIRVWALSDDDKKIIRAKFRTWLQKKGYDGIVYENDVEGDVVAKSFVILDPGQFKESENFGTFENSDWFYYQSKTGEPHRGAMTVGDDWKATIALFEGAADGSTIIHETAHYVFDLMEHFVESGSADERMKSDYRKLAEWMTLTPEQAEKGYEAYLKSLPEGTDAMTPEQWKYIEEQERLARGFEAYCMEGRAPSVELQGAFATLRRILLHIYKTVRALGVKLTDDVRQVFDGMLATETTLMRDSILLEAAEQIDRELLGLSQSEVKTFRELIEKSNEQAVAEMTAEKNAKLKELRKQWRAEAKALMDGDPVYNVWYAVQKEGKMDYLAVQEIAGEYIAQRLKDMGLATKPGRRTKDGKYPNAKSGKHPATMAAQAGFDTVEDMIDQLLASKSPQDFTAEYMADEERKFNAEFEMSEKAQSVRASIEALEKLSEMLAVKGGQIGYRFRRALLKQQAIEELNKTAVSHIVSDKKLIADCRMNARALTKAANEGDFTTAFERAKALRFNLEVLRLKGDARKAVEDTVSLLRKGRHAKKGTIYGDHQDALTDLSVRFGFTRTAPKAPLQHTVASVVAEFNEEAAANGDLPLEVPEWMLTRGMDYRAMTFGQFQELANLAEFLYGEGKEIVSARNETFRNSVKQAVEGTVAELKEQKHKYARSQNFIVKGWRGMVQWGTKLRNIIGMAVNWNPDSTLQKLYDEMAFAESEQTQIMADPMRKCTEALDALYRSTHGLDFTSLADIPFPQDVKAEGYRKWDAEKLVAACLNMGTLKNRQRLLDGYEWGENGEEYASRLASMLTAEDWANIQKIWDAMATLTPRTAQTFKEEYHYDLRLEEAAPFTVQTKDGREVEVAGGYYPLEYLYHKNTVVDDRAEALKNAPRFRRASFTFERNEGVTDPLALSLNLVFTHIFDASHYISHRHTMRKVLRVINDRAFRSHFQQTQGFERYSALKALIENVAAPGAALKGMTSGFENWGRSVVTAYALWASPSVVAMQLSSISYGLDELGGYYLEAAAENMAHPVDTYHFVMEHSGMMRDRVNLKDLDLKARANEFKQNMATRIRETVKQIGYSPMRFVDLAVAIPAWKAAYDKALDEGKSDSQAVAAADEFVAKTQGATRAIDMSPLQLKAYGRGLTVFFSAVSAGSTMATRTINRIFGGNLTPGEAAYSATMNIILPLFFSCLIRYAIAGAGAGDDPDKARRAFLRELITNPFQGIPLIRDVADFAANRTVGKSKYAQRTVFENTSLRGASDLVVTAFDGVEAAFEENPDRAMYKLADAVGTLFQVPVVRVYERLRQMLVDWTGDEKILPDIDEETKHKKSNKRRRH